LCLEDSSKHALAYRGIDDFYGLNHLLKSI
jgi:hypothetical protein